MSDASSAQTLQRIAATARSGKLDAAALLVERARSDGDTNPMIAALGGAIEFHRNQFARAIPLLNEALTHHPSDLTVRANLAEALLRTGETAAALALCINEALAQDVSLRLTALAAHLSQEAADYPRAIALYRRIAASRADDWSIWNNLGNALSAAGEAEEAAEALGQAAVLAPDSAPICLNLGNALFEAGRIGDAERVLRDAGMRFANDPHPHLALFAIYRTTGREDEAFEAIRVAAQRSPDSADIQSDFGQEAARRNEYVTAEQAYEAALALKPALGPAFVGLASVYERMNRESELDPLRIRAAAQGVDDESIAYIDALRFKRQDQIDAAFAALEQAGDVVVPGRKHHLRGIMLDRLGRHDEAFAAFAAMNEHWQADPSQPSERARLYRDMTRAAAKLLSLEWIASWTAPPPPDPRPTPIFLLGFPRSGTTLLDTMLMADPKVRVLEEEPFIGMAEQELGGLEALPDLTTAQLTAARDAYFKRAVEKIGSLEGVQVVDKHPLHLNKVGTILRLFPDARFLLSLRHPCDVVLSCFLTNFRINNAMANFLDLTDAAALYDLSFDHWEQSRTLFNPPVATVVYERLVEDSARELRPVFEQLGLEWPGDDFDHRDTARARGTVATASYAQVIEPLYKRAAGRWQRYAMHLDPVLPLLAPWVERFGYSIGDDRVAPWPDGEP